MNGNLELLYVLDFLNCIRESIMTTTKNDFARNRLASAVFCSMIGLPCVAVAATMEGVNEENLAVPPVEGKTLVYTDTEGTASFGWLDPVNDFGNVGLGIKVYKDRKSVV